MTQRDLVFDVGMHRGEDTAYYLRKGYRVVGFEANPELVAACRARFAAEVGDGRLTIVEGAIAPPGTETVTFYRHDTLSIWGTTDPAWVRRNETSGPSTPITVPAVDIAEHLRQAVPAYLKIDIEGADHLCLEALHGVQDRPATVSLESEKDDFSALVAEIDLLEQLGYDRFAAVQQRHDRSHRITTFDLDGRVFDYEFEPEASGGFGPDIDTWLTKDELIARYRRIFLSYRLVGDDSVFTRVKGGWRVRRWLERTAGVPLPGWYDTHAARSR